jgi:hypothetical protein
MRIVSIVTIGALFLLPVVALAQQSIAAWEAEGRAIEKETGIPPMPMPRNIPQQESQSNDLVACSVGGAGRSDYVIIYLKKPDCNAWLRVAMDYNKKYGQALEEFKNRRDAEQERVAEARRQHQAGPGRSIIYALFLCFRATGTCQMQGASRVTFAGVTQDMTFASLAECQEYAKRVSGLVTPPSEGRFMLPNGMWYECRGKSFDTWEPMQ